MMAIPHKHSVSRRNRTRRRQARAAGIESAQVICLSPIDGEESHREDTRPSKEWSSQAVSLLRSLEPNAMVPYETTSKAVDRNPRKIMYHCA